jgi:galactokinase
VRFVVLVNCIFFRFCRVGMTVVCATNEGLYGKCSQHTAGVLLYEHFDIKANETKRIETTLNMFELKSKASEGGFYSYVLGTAAAVLDYAPAKRGVFGDSGIRINNYRTTLPMRKGLSSSAAVCVLVVKAFDAVFGLNLSMAEVMELAYKGEMMTPSRCGRMDQVRHLLSSIM